jgi:peroxiredoxin
VIEVARLLLAAVFAVAAVAKLADREGSRRAARDFGAPARLASVVVLLLPFTELAIAAGLLFAGSTRVAAACAAALLTGFAIAVAVALLRGRTPDCHCFGRLHSRPAGWPVVARNLGLAALAVLVVSWPATSIGLFAAAVFAIGVLVTGQALLWVVLLHRYGDALRRLDALAGERAPDVGLLTGAAVPPFALQSVTGDHIVSLADLLSPDRSLLLVFTDERCGACSALYPEISRWQREFGHEIEVVVLGHGDSDGLRALAEEHDLDPLLIADRGTFVALGVAGTPCALLVEPDGRVAQPMCYGALDIEALVLDHVETHINEVERVG